MAVARGRWRRDDGRRRGGAGHGLALVGLAATVVVGPVWAGPARAEGDPEAAHPILERACSTCHQVPGYLEPESTAGGAAANFQDIADGSQYATEERLTAFLVTPHYPLPGFSMTPEDIANVVAFILSLQE